jgi:hypothetical protein
MGQLVANRIAQVKANNDHVDGINFANYLETEFRKHLETIQFLKAKH